MEQFKSIETTELVKIANAIRLKKGSTDKISLEDMPAMIREIEGGVELPELSNEGTASDLLSGKQLIDGDGNIVTGNIPNNGAISSTMDGLNTKQVTIPAGYTSGGTISLDNTIDNEVDIQADLLAQAIAALEGKASGGGDSGTTINVVNTSNYPVNINGYDCYPDETTIVQIFPDSLFTFFLPYFIDEEVRICACYIDEYGEEWAPTSVLSEHMAQVGIIDTYSLLTSTTITLIEQEPA